MLTAESTAAAAIAQYRSDEDFKRFVDGILVRMMMQSGVQVSPEAFLAQQTQTGVPMASLVYQRYRSEQALKVE